MKNGISIGKYATTGMILALLFSACGGGSTPPSDTLSQDTAAKQEATPLTLEGATAPNGDTSAAKTDQEIAHEELLSALKTKAPAEDVASGKETLFIAEGDKGVEIIKIGYHDRIDHELVARITGINATSVRLSDDQQSLYVQNREGFVNIYDISDIKSPKRIKITDSQSVNLNPQIRNGRYELAPQKDKGFIVYDISNPYDRSIISRYTESAAYALAPIDHDTKAIVATKDQGIDLFDISDLDHIQKIGNHPLPGDTLGVSVNETSGLLFIANGAGGVEVLNLNVVVDTIY